MGTPPPPSPYKVTGKHVGAQFQMLLNLDVGSPLEGWHRAYLILIIEMLHWMTLTEPFGNEKVQLCSRERVIYSSDMCSMGTGTIHIRKITFHLHIMIYLVSITIFTISCKFIHVACAPKSLCKDVFKHTPPCICHTFCLFFNCLLLERDQSATLAIGFSSVFSLKSTTTVAGFLS